MEKILDGIADFHIICICGHLKAMCEGTVQLHLPPSSHGVSGKQFDAGAWQSKDFKLRPVKWTDLKLRSEDVRNTVKVLVRKSRGVTLGT